MHSLSPLHVVLCVHAAHIRAYDVKGQEEHEYTPLTPPCFDDVTAGWWELPPLLRLPAHRGGFHFIFHIPLFVFFFFFYSSPPWAVDITAPFENDGDLKRVKTTTPASPPPLLQTLHLSSSILRFRSSRGSCNTWSHGELCSFWRCFTSNQHLLRNTVRWCWCWSSHVCSSVFFLKCICT